jgi:hypothetical protein
VPAAREPKVQAEPIEDLGVAKRKMSPSLIAIIVLIAIGVATMVIMSLK